MKCTYESNNKGERSGGGGRGANVLRGCVRTGETEDTFAVTTPLAQDIRDMDR